MERRIMALTPEEKERIYNEERNRMHEDQYRAEVRRQIRNPEAQRPGRTRAILVAFLVFVFVAGLLSRIPDLPEAVTGFIALIAALIAGKKTL